MTTLYIIIAIVVGLPLLVTLWMLLPNLLRLLLVTILELFGDHLENENGGQPNMRASVMSKDLTPLEQAQEAYQELRNLLKQAKWDQEFRFSEAPHETDGKQELLEKFAHLCKLWSHSVKELMVSHERMVRLNAELEDRVLERTRSLVDQVKRLMSECPWCGEKGLPAAANHCRQCGGKLADSSSPDFSPDR